MSVTFSMSHQGVSGIVEGCVFRSNSAQGICTGGSHTLLGNADSSAILCGGGGALIFFPSGSMVGSSKKITLGISEAYCRTN